MPSKTASKPRASATADLDDYLLDGDLEHSNPFRSPSPTSKRKAGGGGGGLGIDEEVEVKKRVSVPRVKLDEARLLSANGIPKLRSRAKHLRLKGKNHEWSDASKLLSFYQIWLDDLFPKAQFLDALGMVEKAGHKGTVQKARMEWINEGKPRDTRFDGDEEDTYRAPEERGDGGRIAPIFERAKTAGRPVTPDDGGDLFGDEDIYGATPKGSRAGGGGEPDEDDLDALMAEAERAPVNSIFGGGSNKPASSLFGGPSRSAPAGNEPDEDDLDALMAEAESAPVSSIFGNGKVKAPAVAEADDDLDALMAEVEAEGSSTKPPLGKTDISKDSGPKDGFADDEEAMAEMDGLW